MVEYLSLCVTVIAINVLPVKFGGSSNKLVYVAWAACVTFVWCLGDNVVT